MTGTAIATKVNERVQGRVRPATWWRRPQQVWLRRAIFQVHLWVGVVLALYAIVIGLSGAALVFRSEIEQHLRPELFRIAPHGDRVQLDAVIARVEQERPGWRVSGLEDFEEPTKATMLLLRPAVGELSANYRIVMVNPYTGVEMADRMRLAGVLGWMSNLHYYLLLGKTGLTISGWMTVGLTVLCVTGLVLWWPGVHRWVSALYLRRHVRWRRLNWDLHSVVGFWLALPLLLVCLTGLYFCFPKAVVKVVNVATWSRPGGAETEPQHGVWPESPLSVDAAIRRAEEVLPQNAPGGYLFVPAGPKGAYSVTGYVRGAAPYSEIVSISLDKRTGKLLQYEDSRQKSRGERLIQHAFAWHFGSWGGAGWSGEAVKALWVLVGICPALLAMTGLLMFVARKLL